MRIRVGSDSALNVLANSSTCFEDKKSSGSERKGTPSIHYMSKCSYIVLLFYTNELSVKRSK